MAINFYILFFILFILFVILPTLTSIFVTNKKAKNIIYYSLLTLYLIFLFVGTIVELDDIFPTFVFNFNFNYDWFSVYFLFGNLSLDNLIVNIGLMFPVGFFIYEKYKKSQFLKTILFSFILSLVIEIYQMILPIYRNTEFLDIILNVFSGIISAIYFYFIKNLSKNHKKVISK